MALKRTMLAVEELGERIVPDATPAPPLLTFEQVERVRCRSRPRWTM